MQKKLTSCELVNSMAAYFPEEVVCEMDVTPETVAKMEEDLDHVIRLFDKCQRRWNACSPIFAQWKTKRLTVIEQLEDIAYQLDKHKFNTNVARLVGGSVGIVGGVITIVGISLAPFTFGASIPLIIGGSATAMTGGSTSVGSTITETVLIKKKIKDFHQLMRQHQEDTECLNEWVKDAAEFVAAVNKIVDVNIFNEVITALSAFFLGDKLESFPEQATNAAIKSLIMYIVEQLMRKVLPAAAINAVVIVLTIPKLFRLACRLAKLHSDSPVVFEAVLMSVRVGLQLLRGLDVGVDTVTTLVSAARIAGGVTANVVAKAVAQGFLAGIGVALDITSVVLTSTDVHRGSKSKHAATIRAAKVMLEKGLEQFSELMNDNVLCANDLCEGVNRGRNAA